MISCLNIVEQIALFLDGELQNEERFELEQHLSGCARCRVLVEEERSFLRSISESGRLSPASALLRERVVGVLETVPPPIRAPGSLRRRLQSILVETNSASRTFRHRAVMLTVVLAVLAIGFAGYFVSTRTWDNARPSEMASMAVESHLRRLRGQLPLELVSNSPEEISTWFRDKVPFRLTLPNYQKASGQEQLYYLEGARLVALKNDYAACIAYRMRGRPITLIVTSNATAMPAGGESIVSKGLTFHYDAISGLKVITWADRGLTYALVSDLEERGQQSCVVCHEGTRDRDFLEGFKPASPRI